MAIAVENVSDTDVKIKLNERFDFGCVDDFRGSYESVGNAKKKNVEIDFRATRYMDSSALGMLINAKGYFASSDSKIRLTNCNEQIKKIFSISRFDLKFEIS
jgi:anti-anti-sigma factor